MKSISYPVIWLVNSHHVVPNWTWASLVGVSNLSFRSLRCMRICRKHYWAAKPQKRAQTSVLLCALNQNRHSTQAVLFVDGSRNSVCYVVLQAGYLDSLSSSEFVRLTRMVEDFVMDCERICGRQSHSLRATLLTQAKKFVERFHEERRNKLRYKEGLLSVL